LGVAARARLAIVVVGRLIGRLTLSRLPSEHSSIAHLAAKVVHLLLYALLVAQIGLGIGINWLEGEALSISGLVGIPSALAENRGLGSQLKQLHNTVAWSLMAVVGGHALAALWHRYIIKDGVLHRMLPTMPAR
jgi:cytochrome b561